MRTHTINYIVMVILVAGILFFGGYVHAEVQPTLYNQTGDMVDGYNSETRSLNAGWYYDEEGNPRYYYENGVFYDPSTQSYGGSILYPDASGPQTLEFFTPGVPNTGAGGNAFFAWFALILSASIAVFGTRYLTRSKSS